MAPGPQDLEKLEQNVKDYNIYYRFRPQFLAVIAELREKRLDSQDLETLMSVNWTHLRGSRNGKSVNMEGQPFNRAYIREMKRQNDQEG